jgi:hypothetical protein
MKTLFLSLMIFCGTVALASKPDSLLRLKEDLVHSYRPLVSSGTQLYLKMKYGSSQITNPDEISKIKNANIAAVEIVYSDDPKNKEFSALTKMRMKQLVSICPSCFTSDNVQWRFVRQTNCSDKASAEKLFHGIVITYRPLQTKESMKKEKKELEELLSSLPKKVASTGTYRSTSWVSHGFRIDTISDVIVDSEDFAASMLSPWLQFRDSTVSAVLKRKSWNNMAVVADLTGSMAPYTAQLLVWFKLNTNSKRARQFVFFNDGDMKPENAKVIGEIGGVYSKKVTTFEELQELAFQTMKGGCGGDAPENNVEALLKAEALCPDCDNLVMIADNWANIKDFSLIKSIRKPVKIILCGSDYGINVQYLELARLTGGSVHTMTADLEELMKLNEGEIITIGKSTFVIRNGKFEKVAVI